MPRRVTDFARVLETLRRHDVRFILVGGVAAVIEGAPVTTFDVDVVPDRGEDNVAKLVGALRELEAHYRERPEKAPTAEALSGRGHHLLMTRYGPLDVLGVIGRDRDFTALVPHSHLRKLESRYIRVLDLETQVAIKRELGFRKDRIVLPILEAALAQRRSRKRRR